MRIVYFPMYSNVRNLNGCSTYNYAKEFLRALTEEIKDLFVYWCFPTVGIESAWKWRREKLDIDRVKIVPITYEKKQYDQISIITKEWFDLFNERNGKYYYDVVLTEMPNLAVLIKSVCSSYVRRHSINFPVFIQYGFLMTQEKLGFIPKWLEIAQCMGMAVSYNIFPTQECFERGIRMAKKYLSCNEVKEIEGRSVVIPTGINCNYIDELIKNVKKSEDRFKINFSGRLNEGYNYREALNCLWYVYSSGKDFDVIVTTPSKGWQKDLETKKKYNFMEINVGIPRDEYLKKIAQCHFFIYSMVGGSELPLTVIEQLYCGLLGIFRDSERIRSTLPDWYPEELFYRNKDELLNLIKELLLKYSDNRYKEVRKKLRYYIRSNYDVKNVGLKLYSFIEENYNKNLKEWRVGRGNREIVNMGLKIVDDEFTMEDLRDKVIKFSNTNIDILKPNMKTGSNKMLYYKYLRKIGVVDNCEEEYPIFLK